MTRLDELYEYARERNIEVDYFLLSRIQSLSSRLDDGRLVIAIDTSKIDSESEEIIILAHEIGHCETLAFYLPTSDCCTIRRCENKATRWAIEKILPKALLLEAVSIGYTEPWQIAEYFDLPEKFVRTAMWLYANGNMAAPEF